MCERCRTHVLDYFTGNYDRMKNCFERDGKIIAIDNEGYFGLQPMVAPRENHWYNRDVIVEVGSASALLTFICVLVCVAP
jgi:hypothetical protein